MKHLNELVPVEDFNIDTLKEAFLQGRLYIRPAVSKNTREESIQAILRYVSHIDACASDEYQPTIHRLWEQILRSPELSDLFFLNRYSNNKGQPNWYRVNAVMLILLEQNIYRRDSYTAVQLHLMMEQTTKRTSHYTGMNHYLLERPQIKVLMQYIEKLRLHE